MSYTIRPARAEDMATIVELYCSDPDFLRHHLGLERVDSVFVREDQAEMARAGFRSCVVEDAAGRMIAVLDYRPGAEVYLCLLLVDRAFRGGTGRGIYEQFEAEMRRAGAGCIRLDAVTDYEGNAVPFWEKLGFTRGEYLTLRWGEKVSGMVVMRKRI